MAFLPSRDKYEGGKLAGISLTAYFRTEQAPSSHSVRENRKRDRLAEEQRGGALSDPDVRGIGFMDLTDRQNPGFGVSLILVSLL